MAAVMRLVVVWTLLGAAAAVAQDGPGPSTPAADSPAAAQGAVGPGAESPSGQASGSKAAEAAPNATSTDIKVKAYGFVILNTAYNTGTVNSLEAPTVALPGSGDGLATDGAFILTPRQSRVGLRAEGSLSEKLEGSAIVEIDFWGLHGSIGPGAITQPTIRLRRAFFTLGSKELSLLVGQDWAILNRPWPPTLGHIVIPAFTGGGNLWNRVPQITARYNHTSGFGAKLSLMRSHSGDGTGVITQLDIPDPGALSELPAVQARLSFGTRGFSIGAGGHAGRERYRLTDAEGDLAGHMDVGSWATSADIEVAASGLSLYAEGFVGANLNGLFSIAGVRRIPFPDSPIEGTVRDVEAVRTKGGWIQLSYAPRTSSLTVSLAAGLERPDEDQLAPGAIRQNSSVMASVVYSPVKRLDIGLEYLRNLTDFEREEGSDRPGRGENHHLNLALRLKF